jgi:hypothetical protein
MRCCRPLSSDPRKISRAVAPINPVKMSAAISCIFEIDARKGLSVFFDTGLQVAWVGGLRRPPISRDACWP